MRDEIRKAYDEMSAGLHTYDDIEISFVAAILLNTEFLNRISGNMVIRDTFETMIDIARESTNIKSVPRPYVLSKIIDNKLPVPRYEIDAVYQRVEEFKLISNESLADEFMSALFLLNERQERNDIGMELNYASELLRRGKVKECIAHVKSLPFRNTKILRSTKDLMIEAVDKTNGFRTNIETIDNVYGGLIKANLMSIFGDSGAQKTRFSLWLCLSILMANPEFTCLYFEKEMLEKDIASYITQHLVEISMDEILHMCLDDNNSRREQLKETIQIAMETDDELVNAIKRLHVVPLTSFYTATDIYEWVESKKPDIWCLDYLTLLREKKQGREENRTENVERSLMILKECTLTTNSFGIVLSQLNKGTVESRFNKIPIVDDMPYGNSLKHFSAYIWALFYPRKYYPHGLLLDDFENERTDFYLINHKTRHSDLVDIYFRSNPAHLRYSEITKENSAKDQYRMEQWITKYQRPPLRK